MRITPLDVRKQEFRKSVRGFDCDEVRAYLETLSHEYETVLVDNKHLREQFVEQDEKLTEYATLERTLRDTLMTAQRVMQDTRENAHKESQLIVQDAQLKAKSIMDECRLRTEELRREVMSLRQEKDNYLGRFESLATAQIQFINNHKSDFKDVDNRLLELASSAIPQAEEQHPSADTTSVMTATGGGGNERDMWRNYETKTEAGSSAEPTDAIPTAKTERGQVTAAAVDMAAMGIPVPAVPSTVAEKAESGETDPVTTCSEAGETANQELVPT